MPSLIQKLTEDPPPPCPPPRVYMSTLRQNPMPKVRYPGRLFQLYPPLIQEKIFGKIPAERRKKRLDITY